jgi:DNA-binding MarR family transcriptional regulator
MKLLKPFFLTSAAITALFSQVMDSVAVLVNDEPITSYEIKQIVKKENISKSKAVDKLVDKLLYDQLIRKYRIQVDLFETDKYIENLADSNSMDVVTFKSFIKQKYPNYKEFLSELNNKIKRDKLVTKLVKDQIPVATDKDIEIYYNKNIDEFTEYSKVKVIQYSSQNRVALKQHQKNPFIQNNAIKQDQVELDTSKVSPDLKFLLSKTPKSKFTPILVFGGMFTTFYISDKSDEKKVKLSSVRNRIFNMLMKKRENKFLKEFFERSKISADIKVIR